MDHMLRIARWSVFFLCCQLLISGYSQSLAQRGKSTQPTRPNAVLDIRCRSGQPFPATQYTVALYFYDNAPRVFRPVGGNAQVDTAIDGFAVVLVKGPDRHLYPIVQGPESTRAPFQLRAHCDPQPFEPSDYFPKVRLTPRVAGAESVRALAEHLVAQSGMGISRQLMTVFRRAEAEPVFANLPTRAPAQGVTISSLIEDYMSSREPPAFLTGFSGAVDVQVATTKGVQLAWVPPPKEAAPTAAPEQSAEFTITFRRREFVQDPKLHEEQRIETFGYCKNEIELRDTGYLLRCAPGVDGKVPIRIRGFKELIIGPREANLDDRLEVVGFRSPYPALWRRPTTDFLEVPSGRLADVLNRAIEISQGPAGCNSTVKATIAAIVRQSVTLPEPPCRRYELVFPDAAGIPTAQVKAGCQLGADIPTPIRNGRVSCWARSQAGATKLTVDLFPGFSAIVMTVPVQRDGEVFEQKFQDIAPHLTPIWPYQGQTPFDAAIKSGDAPRYVARSVEYVDRRGQACNPMPLSVPAQGAPQMAPVAAAGCQSVPSEVRITFEQEAVDNPQGPPAEAFVPSYVDKYQIATIAQNKRALAIDELKRALAVGFGAERLADYQTRFGERAGNTSFPGIYLFAGDCSDRANGQFVRFGQPSGQVKWPVSAAVFDAKSKDPLSRCAKARIEKTERGESYFTFELEPARAIGPRRVVVIANSQSFYQLAGTAAALRDALHSLVDAAHDAYKRRLPLSPINIYSVDGKGDFKPLFSGEEAAFEPDKAKTKVNGIDRVAPSTPKFMLIRLQPELTDNEFEKVVFVMDGSQVDNDNKGQLALLANQLAKRDSGNVAFYITSNSCATWRKDIADFKCIQLASTQPARKETLSKAFVELLSPPAAEAAPTPPQATVPVPTPPPQLRR